MEKLLITLGIIAIAALLLLEGYNKWLDIEAKHHQMPKQEIERVVVYDTIKINVESQQKKHIYYEQDLKSEDVLSEDVPTKSNGYLLFLMVFNCILGLINLKIAKYCQTKSDTDTISGVFHGFGFCLFFVLIVCNILLFAFRLADLLKIIFLI